MKRNIIAVVLLALALLFGGFTAINAGDMKGMAVKSASSENLRIAMRVLWQQHVLWTRLYVISNLEGLADADKTAGRLLKNQEDLGNAIAPYYGYEAGEKLTILLKEHIMIAVDVVNAAKTGNTKELDMAQKRWKSNALQIASFLSGANKNWKKSELEDHLIKHLDMTTEEVTARLNKDWAADIAAYDRGEAHMLMFADVLTSGIVGQFPNKFK